jgi:hypothetical protein
MIPRPFYAMAHDRRLRRDLEAVCRALGIRPDIRQGANAHLKVFDASGRLLTSVASSPRDHDHTIRQASHDLARALRGPQ